MNKFNRKFQKKMAPAASQEQPVLAEVPPESAARSGTLLGSSSGSSSETSLGSSLAVFWMWVVLLGFLFVRVIGSQSFQALHWFGRTQ